MKYKIAVLSDIHLLEQAQLKIQDLSENTLIFPQNESRPSIKTLVERTGDAEAILVSPGINLTTEYFDACPSVNYVGLCGTSATNIDTDTMKKRGIDFSRVVDYGDEPTAEFIFMQLVALARGINSYQWKPEPTELMNKRLGIVGLGVLGKSVAHLGLAYKMKVDYYSLHRKSDWEEKGLHYQELHNLLGQSDVVVITSPSNLVVLGKKEFESIKTNAILVQASMGSVIDKESFLAWIAKEDNFAIFDYAAGDESYQAYSGLERVVFPRIIAGHTMETKQRLGQKVLKNLEVFFTSR